VRNTWRPTRAARIDITIAQVQNAVSEETPGKKKLLTCINENIDNSKRGVIGSLSETKNAGCG